MFNKEKRERRKSRKRYRKMTRRHTKELIKMAKKSYDYDYGFLHELVVLKLKNMYEYYVAGDNVWQTNETRNRIIETLKNALELAEKIEDFWKVNLDQFKGNAKAYYEAETQTYIDFYSYIGQNIEWWWD